MTLYPQKGVCLRPPGGRILLHLWDRSRGFPGDRSHLWSHALVHHPYSWNPDRDRSRRNINSFTLQDRQGSVKKNLTCTDTILRCVISESTMRQDARRSYQENMRFPLMFAFRILSVQVEKILCTYLKGGSRRKSPA